MLIVKIRTAMKHENAPDGTSGKTSWRIGSLRIQGELEKSRRSNRYASQTPEQTDGHTDMSTVHHAVTINAEMITIRNGS